MKVGKEKQTNKLIEYKVRPVTRYIVTRYESSVTTTGLNSGSSENMGEFENVKGANLVCSSLAHKEDKSEYKTISYKLYSHDYDETNYPNFGAILVE